MILHLYSCLHYFKLLPINCASIYSTYTKCNSQFLGREPDTVLKPLCVLSLFIPQPSFKESTIIVPISQMRYLRLKEVN